MVSIREPTAAPGASGSEADPPEKDEGGEVQEKDGSSPMNLEEIEACDLQEMAKDKFKSRLLQRSLLRGSPEVAELIFKKAEPFFMELVRDQYGNYLSQKILEVSNTEQFDQLFSLLNPHLSHLSQDIHGTRAVQKVVEQAISRGKVAELLEALPGDLVEKLARSVTGFHVIVKLLEALPAKEAEDLLQRLCGSGDKVLSLGRDQWGCCVLKKCVDRADGTVRHRIVDAIADNALSLVQDPFGNYVVQHLILAGPNPHISRIIDSLRGRMFELSLQKFSSNVLEKCLLNSTDKDRNRIINEILNPPTCLPSEAVRMLLFHQYGNYVFQQALEVAKDPQFSLLVEHAKQHVQDIVRAQGSETSQATGTLASEHARRLAMKLVKKYPPFSEGLEMEGSPMATASPTNSSWNGNGMASAPQFYDPYAQSYGGYDAYGTSWAGGGMQMPGPPVYGYPFPPWDPSFGAYMPPAYPPVRGPGKGGRGGGDCGPGAAARARSQGRRFRGSRGGQKTGESKDRGSPRKQAAAGSGPAVGAGGGGGGAGQTVRVGRIVGFWPNYTVTYDEVPAPSGGSGRGSRLRNKAKGKAVPKRSTAPLAGASPTQAPSG